MKLIVCLEFGTSYFHLQLLSRPIPAHWTNLPDFSHDLYLGALAPRTVNWFPWSIPLARVLAVKSLCFERGPAHLTLYFYDYHDESLLKCDDYLRTR